MLNIFTTLMASLLLTNVVYASSNTEQVDWPNDLSDFLKSSPIQQVGEATLSVLVWDIYQSKLATASGQYPDPNNTVVYQINYLRNIESEDLIDKTIEQWQHIGIEDERYTPYLSKLRNIWPDISEGDQLAFASKGSNSAFYFNEELVGTISNPDFTDLFLAIWFSEKTSQPELRAALLGNES